MVTGVLARTPSTAVVSTTKGRATLHVVAPDHVGTGLVWHTGSRRHTALLQQRAERFGLTFVDGTVAPQWHPGRGPDRRGCSTATSSCPRFLRSCAKAATRSRARASGDLPRLVTTPDIRGDLHMHTTWSDGRDTLEMMIYSAKSLGYEYVAITDHSERAWSSRKLSAADVPRQREEIEAVRRHLQGIEVLHGVEVDIMKDGTLDFPDTLLEGFDIVLASLHDHGGQSGEELTSRYLQAIEHPLVNVITHPANRSPAVSKATTWTSIACSLRLPRPERRWRSTVRLAISTWTAVVARRATAAGVTVTIDSDCHRAEALSRQMRFGVGTARRGWVEPRHVLNTQECRGRPRFRGGETCAALDAALAAVVAHGRVRHLHADAPARHRSRGYRIVSGRGDLSDRRRRRQAYPLYFDLATPFVQLTGASNPPRTLNLFSALCGAIAAGLLTWLVAAITASRAGGIVAGLLLAFSYTFWTQAVIAEVYTLHLALIGLVLAALRWWQQRQTLTRTCGRLCSVCAGVRQPSVIHPAVAVAGDLHCGVASTSAEPATATRPGWRHADRCARRAALSAPHPGNVVRCWRAAAAGRRSSLSSGSMSPRPTGEPR